MEAGEDDGASLVVEREAEMLPLSNPSTPFTRKASFLEPTANYAMNTLPPSLPPSISFTSQVTATKILFEGWPSSTPTAWEDWMKKLRPIYGDSWRKAGIFDAIQSSTYKIKKDSSLVVAVSAFWCEKTNTFHFPWAEATVTLEDVMVLGDFSVLGESVRSSLEGELAELEAKMVTELRKFNKFPAKKPQHSTFMKHYYLEGDKGELEHIAFLSLWLSKFVISSHPAQTVGPCVLPVAVRLARGIKVALAPAVLASIYRDLRVIRGGFVGDGDGKVAPLIVWAPFRILQLWLWERFPALCPDSRNFVEFDAPRAVKWHDALKKSEISNVRSVLESPSEFKWRPYAAVFDKWRLPSFYIDEGKWFGDGEAKDDDLRSFGRCLRVCELVGMDCIEQYLPNRVARQFGLDQDIPMHVQRVNSSWEVSWATYDMPEDSARFYVTPSLFQPDITVRYFNWWKQCFLQCSDAVQGDMRAGSAEKDVGRVQKELKAGKMKRRVQCLLNGNKQDVKDADSMKLSDWLSLNTHQRSSKSETGESQNHTQSSVVNKRRCLNKLKQHALKKLKLSDIYTDEIRKLSCSHMDTDDKSSLGSSVMGEATCETDTVKSTRKQYSTLASLEALMRRIVLEKKRKKASSLGKNKKQKLGGAHDANLLESECLSHRKNDTCNDNDSAKSQLPILSEAESQNNNRCIVRQIEPNSSGEHEEGIKKSDDLRQSKAEDTKETGKFYSSEILKLDDNECMSDSKRKYAVESAQSHVVTAEANATLNHELAKLNREDIEDGISPGGKELGRDDNECMSDLKAQEAEESAHSHVETEEPNANFEHQLARINGEGTEEGITPGGKELEVEKQIKKLKQEIAAIQARVMDLESQSAGKTNSAPSSLHY